MFIVLLKTIKNCQSFRLFSLVSEQASELEQVDRTFGAIDTAIH